mmetsp:Transcript_43449/g.100564  ORF Transcript_43449/g.100564 Transcript_43449/m.100564 type:complete len:87 (+) Transcript_43449:602-862(+)
MDALVIPAEFELSASSLEECVRASTAAGVALVAELLFPADDQGLLKKLPTLLRISGTELTAAEVQLAQGAHAAGARGVMGFFFVFF